MKEKVISACVEAGKKSEKGLIYILTSEKFIQGAVTSLLLGIITASTEGLGIFVSRMIQGTFGVFIPAKWTMVPLLVTLLAFFLWADNNTEEWRDFVRETTGEEPAEDEAESYDGSE